MGFLWVFGFLWVYGFRGLCVYGFRRLGLNSGHSIGVSCARLLVIVESLGPPWQDMVVGRRDAKRMSSIARTARQL